MTMRETVFRIEELQVQAEKINSIQSAIFQAIYNGQQAVSDYEWAFCALGDLTFALKNDLEVLMNEAFDYIKQNDNKAVG